MDSWEFLPNYKAAMSLIRVEILKNALLIRVVSVYKECKALSLTRSDNCTVVAKLHCVLDVVCTPTHHQALY